mgnify:CR=1 FL=1
MLLEKHWILPEDIELPSDFQESIGGDPLVAQALYRRGIQTLQAANAFLDPDAFDPCSPAALPDSETAWDLLQEALNRDQSILVWGDFDVDGQTATALLVEALRELGGRVDYHIPIRGQESHGISTKVLETYIESGFDLLLTCDTGIVEHENVLRVRQADKPVIISDHHTLGETLPPANAIVNPQRLAPGHPLRTLPGVGVAYKLMQGFYQRMRKPFRAAHYLELTALGIVADVAELHQDTRYLLQKGLASLHQTGRIGLQTLYSNAELNPLRLTETHIGFQIGPRLNAVGRLADANPMVEFLTTQDTGRARVLGTQIEALNAKRRFATRQVEKAAEAKLAASPDDRHSPAIVLHHPDWPGGVVGIVASRLVDQYGKPVILLTGEDPIHGSARSIKGLNITESIASQSSLLNGFGGHPMAAGLSMPAENLPAFKYGFQAAVEARLEGVEALPEIQIDGELNLDEISFELVEQIERLAPFGPGNPPLRFLLRELDIASSASLGSQGEHRQVTVSDQEGNTQRILWWNGGDEPLPEAQFDLICTLSLSDYKGHRQISAEWVDYRLSEQGKQAIAEAQIEFVDLRGVPFPEKELQKHLEANQEIQVWAEGPLPEDFAGKPRHELQACDKLVIWTSPPSQNVLQEVLRVTHPRKLIVFGLEPTQTKPKALLERLGGLVKYTIHHKGGETRLTQLAGVCATEVDVIRVGLKLWEAMGKIEVDLEGDQVRLNQSSKGSDQANINTYSEIFQALIREINAYRNYFSTSKLENLLPK